MRSVSAGRLLTLLSDWSPPFPGFHLCYPSRKQLVPAVGALVGAIRQSRAENV